MALVLFAFREDIYHLDRWPYVNDFRRARPRFAWRETVAPGPPPARETAFEVGLVEL